MPGDIFALRNAGNTCTHAEAGFSGRRIYKECMGLIQVMLADHVGLIALAHFSNCESYKRQLVSHCSFNSFVGH